MKPIGGYLELECGRAPLFHKDGVYLNLCRSAIRYVVRSLRIRKIHIPYYTCHTVSAALRAEECEIIPYEIDDHFLPKVDFPHDDFIIYNNYFGVMGRNVEVLAERYPNLIVDNAQAFYSKPKCRAVVYSQRKFFGLPDGGILCGKDLPRIDLETATSYSEMMHLLKRHDLAPQEGYGDFVASDERMETMPVMVMSKLTRALMGNLDYEFVAARRKENFAYLHSALKSTFPFAMAQDDIPLVYPIFTDNRRLRTQLIQNKIFVPSYWPGVRNSNEYNDTIIPLPIDQRYDERDMNRIVEVMK